MENHMMLLFVAGSAGFCAAVCARGGMKLQLLKSMACRVEFDCYGEQRCSKFMLIKSK